MYSDNIKDETLQRFTYSYTFKIVIVLFKASNEI